jgi:hypothetical protein
MNYFFRIGCLWIIVLLLCNTALVQAQKCGKTTNTTAVAIAEEKQTPQRLYSPPPKYQPLVSVQTQIPSKHSKINQKRRQRFWKRQQKKRKKGCPAAKF